MPRPLRCNELMGLVAITSENDGMSNSKHALITGITGQDGSYLAELLLKGLHRAWHKTPG